jgi:hypothetical protein
MKVKEARRLGAEVAESVGAGEIEQGYALLAPTLARRTRFASLDLIGRSVGREPMAPVNTFLARLAADATEGGWAVIGSALGQQLERDLSGAIDRCREFIVAADVWYGADIIAERVPGPALVADFEAALPSLAPWRGDENVWIRRAVGVAVHFWAKRSRGAEGLAPQAGSLLSFLEPLFWEWEMEAVKGVGWGLKTLGRHYPGPVAGWLAAEVIPAGRRHRALMLRKALTYLSEQQRARIQAAEPEAGANHSQHE